jgi:DNA uptake protein ComE-like DNA-binding protein
MPAASGAVDLNTASQKDLEALPGVGAATAKKIIAGRPYSSVEDLARAGLSEKAIQKVTPLVKVDAAAAVPKAAPGKTAATPRGAAPAAGGIDLNTASQKDLESLPGVGVATAKKIIAGRPYSSVADLSRAGVSAKTVEKITPLVTVGAATAAAAPARVPSGSPAAPPAAPARTGAPAAPSSAPAPSVEARTPPAPGMVWVNTATKVFHREGDPWYGRTKEGKFMTEADAIQAGYRASKQGGKK